MKKEKEIQDELEKYWGQLDRIERMLRWLVYEETIKRPTPMKNDYADISDILEEKD